MPLGAEETHGVGGLHLPEFLIAAALQESAASGLQNDRTKPSGEQDLRQEVWKHGESEEKIFSERRDAVPFAPFVLSLIALIRRVQSAVCSEHALETIQHEQRSGIFEEFYDRRDFVDREPIRLDLSSA
jgi:hypothetical protein